MSIAHHEVAHRWANQILDGPCALSMRGTNVQGSGDRIMSYGWWEMARIVRDKRERPIFFLVNGDRYSPSTTQHQGNVRSGAQSAARAYEEKTGRPFPILIVPYTALDAANADKDSIIPLDIRDDRWVSVARSSNELPNYSQPIPGREGEAWQIYSHNGEYAEITFRDGKYRWTGEDHRLGDSLFSAQVTGTRTRKATPEERAQIEAFAAWNAEYQALPLDAGWEVREAHRAKMPDHPDSHERGGETVVTYSVTKRVKFLSSFDYQEVRAPYFLCELPRTAASTVEEAYDVLMPDPVRRAVESSLEVTRQGDIFAIPTAHTTRELTLLAKPFEEEVLAAPYGEEGYGWTKVEVKRRKRAQLLSTNHTATEVIITEDGETYARGILRHEVESWRTPDHARRRMGTGTNWHRIVKNTVPLDKSHYRGARAGANQSGQSRAWTIGGAVD